MALLQKIKYLALGMAVMMIILNSFAMPSMAAMIQNQITVSIGSEPVKEENRWVGRYDEYLINSNQQFSNKVYKEQYIPYLELNENGTYLYNTNWLVGMSPLSGTWKVDENNTNIIHLSKANGINHEIIFEKISDTELVLRGTDYIRDDRERSTSAYGDLYLKKDYLQSTNLPKISENYPNDWALVYLDIIRSAALETTAFGQWLMIDDDLEGISNVRLYDINSDNKPELFISDKYEDVCYIYTVKEGELLVLDIIYGFNDISIMKNIKTGKEEIICKGQSNRYNFTYRLDINDNFTIESNTIAGWFSEPIEEGKIGTFYYVDEEQASKSDYDKALQNFNNTHKLIKRIQPYKINFTNMANKSDAVTTFIKVIDDYIIHNGN